MRRVSNFIGIILGLIFSIAVAYPAFAGGSGPSPDIVISQVYGGGGNSGATLKNDFIELFNRGSAAVSINGWSVQYASATGTTWQVTNLSGTIQPGQYYLVQEAAGTGGTQSLPTPDATGAINMSGTAGKVALVTSTTALSCGSNCATNAVVRDYVGFGTTANNYEGGGPTPAPSNTASVLRAGNGCTDTDNNNADFTAVAPNPRNSTSTTSVCATPVNGACGSDNGQTLAATAPSNLCTAGSASAVGGNGHPWSWTCNGANGGSPASCSATIRTYTLTFNTDGNGTLSGATSQTIDYSGSTTAVTANANSGYSFVNWTGDNGFVTTTSNPLSVNSSTSDQTVTANFSATPISGACGTDNGQTLAAMAPSNLCTAGNPSAVGGSGHPWTWTCVGANGGSTASCSATIQTYTLTFNTDGNGTLSGAVTQTIDYNGSSTAVTANPNSGYNFKNWTGNNGFVATVSNPLPITNVTASWTITANFRGGFTIFHVNDTHARITPHWWVIPQHSSIDSAFEEVGGAAYLAGEMLQLTASQPNSLVIDAGDISEGNPVGDMNGNGSMTQFYTLLSNKLMTQRGRGIDAMVVGNHDVRDATYISNILALQSSGVPVISANLRDVNTHLPYFPPYTTVTINGTKIGILGYTTSDSEVGASLSNTLEVVACDWNGNVTPAVPCHLADYVNELRNIQGCDVVILAAHVGHSALVDPAAAMLIDNGAAKLPEVAVTGHWHTWTDTVWQPEMLNYKTIFTESDSYMKYIGELNVTDEGRYVSSTQHVIRDTDITPDPDVQTLINNLTGQYNAAHPGHPVDELIGYTADDLLLDNEMKWWSADEYPWSGNNSAGQWICDAMQWKAVRLFGQCDLAIEAGGGVRADIPAGPVTYLQIYETFPWNDDTFYRVNMSGQEIINFLKTANMDAGFSGGLDVTAFDGIPTSVKFNGQPIDPARTYTVAINSYMYAHPPTGWIWSDTSPLTSTVLCRDGIVDYMRQFTAGNPYHVGGPRYHLNTEYSGGYRAVVTMMNDNDTEPVYEYAFARFLSATPETLARRGSGQVPSDLVNEDGTINAANRLSEQEIYRSYLGFKTGVLKPGDIIETWGKGSFYGGNPEFVDQEGIYADGVEFRIVGHDESLAMPAFVSSIGSFWNDSYKNHYVQFLAKKTGANTAADQFGQTIKLWDATGYAAKTLPGNVGDMLLISGVPTMESYALRFRSDSAVTTSASFPAVFSVSSSVNSIPGTATTSPLTLTATASAASGTWYLAPAADAQVASGHATTNYGTATNLYVQSAASGYGNERAWLKFDLSSVIPVGSTISSSVLQLWDWKATGAALPAEVRGGDSDTWSETGITWNTQPTFGLPIDTEIFAAGSANLWYTWDVTSFAQSKWSGNKLVSLVVKAVTEGSTDATSPSYGFDAKEYGSNAPVLQVSAQDTVAQVQYFYRHSSDGINWGGWTLYGTVGVAPWTLSFTYPEGAGHYEFYSVASDASGNVQPTPLAAQAGIIYTQPSDISAQINVTSTGFLYSRASRLYTGNLIITNNGPDISGMIEVVLNGLTTGTTLVNATGQNNGTPMIQASTNGLAAGASITVPLQFSDPSNARINFTPVILQE